MKQISGHVYVEDQFSIGKRGANFGFVTTSEGIVLIDPPYLPTDAIKLRRELAKRGEVRYIINTEHHIDHIAGNSFFPGTGVSIEGIRELLAGPVTDMVPSERLEEVLKDGLDLRRYYSRRVKERDPEGLPLLKNYRFRPPTITFSHRLCLYVGSHTFELSYMPGHTQSHLGVYIPQEKVFFAGDNVTNRTQPSMAQSFPLEWVKTLKMIETMAIDWVVPGHGMVGSKKEVREFRLFLQKCIKIIRNAIRQGLSKEEAADNISFDELSFAKHMGKAVHPGKVMQRRNVLRFFEMLSKA